MKRAFAALLLAATAGLAAAPAEATLITYAATLSGAAEAPPNASPGTGSTVVTIDTALQTMQVAITFSGLTGTTTASHIHCRTAIPGTGTAGVATITPNFTGFPLGVTAGVYSFTYSLNTAPAPITPPS